MSFRIASLPALRLVNIQVLQTFFYNIADEDRAWDKTQPGFIETFNIVRAQLSWRQPMLDAGV